MTNLSVDAIRREIGQARDRLAFLHRDQTKHQEMVEQLEAQLAANKTGLEGVIARIRHEERVIDALTTAASVLAEHMPAPIPDIPAAAPSEPKPVHERNAQGGNTPRCSPRQQERRVFQRAEELDLTEVSDVVFERADWVAQLLVEEGPMRQYQIAEHITQLLECKTITAQSIVSDCMPVLVRQGRVQVHEMGVGGSERYAVWEAKPPEVASGGIGAPLDNYEGTTTRWPKDSQKPPVGSHITIETNPIEAGKNR